MTTLAKIHLVHVGGERLMDKRQVAVHWLVYMKETIPGVLLPWLGRLQNAEYRITEQQNNYNALMLL